VVAEDLVAAARDRLGRRGGDAVEDVRDAVAPRLGCPRDVEAAGAVVQQRRVGRPQRERDGRVRLVPGGGDRVEAAAGRLELARGEVAEPAAHLGAPQLLRLGRSVPVAGRQRAQRVEQVGLEGVERHDLHSLPAGAPSGTVVGSVPVS